MAIVGRRDNEEDDLKDDPNLLHYCNYCVQQYTNGTLDETLETLNKSLQKEWDDYYGEVEEDPGYLEVDNSTICGLAKDVDSILVDRLLLIPAGLLIIIFSFFLQRKYLCRNLFYGRPGFIFPVNLLECQRNRFSFVASFVLLSWVMVDLVIADKGNEAFPFYEHEMYPNMRAFYMLAACIMRAVEFYPLFATLTLDNAFVYGLGSLYAWALLVVFFTDDRVCLSGQTETKIIQLMRIVPPALCLIYLSLYFPIKCVVRLISVCRPGKKKTEEDIWQLSYNVLYVKELSNRHKAIFVPPTTVVDKIRYKTYWPLPTFRYSISILTAVFTGLAFTYMTALLVLSKMYQSIESLKKVLKFAMHESSVDPKIRTTVIVLGALIGMDPKIAYKTMITECLYWTFNVIQPVVYASLTLAFLSVLASMLFTMRNYRHNLFLIYKRQNYDLKEGESFGARSTMLKAVKFVGYQISYAAWGFMIQFYILALILLFIVGVFIFMFKYGYASIYVNWVIAKFWCMIVTLIMLTVVQNLMVHFLFLRKGDTGSKVLALDNRRIFFNFQYFAVFTNIAVGLLSCILRIFRAVFFGLWTVPRLDMSTLSRYLEQLDAGYMAYVGLLYLEHTQRNPTMLTFVQLLLDSRQDDQSKGELALSKKPRVRHKVVCNRYFLWITLERNPGLRLYRKSIMQSLDSTELDMLNKKKDSFLQVLLKKGCLNMVSPKEDKKEKV